MRIHRFILIVFLSIVILTVSGSLLCPTVQAAQLKLLISEKPYYTDVPITLQVSAEGFEESPQPTIHVDPPKHGQLEFLGVSPSVSSSIQIINGAMKQWKRILLKYNYRFLADKKGSYTVGPFTVSQGSEKVTTQVITFKVGEIPVGGDQRLQLVIPKGPFVVGQRIPVQLEWWIHTDLVENLVKQEARVPLFQMIETFRFIEEESEETQNAMVIQTPSGLMKFPATAREAIWKGDSYIVLTVARTLIPLKSGEHRIAPSSVILEEGVRWRRSLFGQRTASHVRKLRVQDRQQTLSVQPLPTNGRPPSFAGAIGQGFTLDVAAQRTVLQAGDPIQLTITLRGEDAAIASASLPSLAAGGGLSTRDFRVPEGETAGIVQEGSKRFEVMVRVLHDGVKEIPPLAYSWFNPELGTYQTTHSRPIALSVGSAHVVSASDVIRSNSSEPEPQTAKEQQTGEGMQNRSASATATEEKPPIFTLMGADLAIEQDADILLHGRGAFLDRTLIQVFCYLLGISLIGLAVWRRRFAELDPEIVARRQVLVKQLSKVENAVVVQDIADALRQTAAVASGFPRHEFDALLEVCDNLVFAPGGKHASLDKGLQERAIDLVQRVMEEKA